MVGGKVFQCERTAEAPGGLDDRRRKRPLV
jgi:hypothetical protein